MSQTPFFSVIIPTKNRSQRVANAIRSVLRQTFADYEVIVVDNDDTNATAEVVRQFTDQRIRYVRTGGLSMADNWERGRLEARGEYLKILPDRQLIKAWTLERVYSIVEREQAPVVSWLTGDIDDSEPGKVFFKLLYKKTSRTVSELDSKELLLRFLRQEHQKVFSPLPRGINSVCHRDLAQRIADGPAGRLYHSVAPDFTSAYLQLAYTDSILFLDESLNISCSGESTGRDFRMKKGKTRSAFIRDIGEPRFYNLVPIKALLTQNSLFNDYLNMQALVPEMLGQYPLSPVNYFVLVYADMRLYELVGVKTADDLRAWEAALAEQPQEVQSAVRAGIRSYVRKYAVTLGNRIDYVWLQQAIRRYKKAKGPRFANVLDALEWEEKTFG